MDESCSIQAPSSSCIKKNETTEVVSQKSNFEGSPHVINCIMNGEIIEHYINDYPYPSCLIFGYTLRNRVIHVVLGYDGESVYIVTAYYPNTDKFEADLKTRKEQ